MRNQNKEQTEGNMQFILRHTHRQTEKSKKKRKKGGKHKLDRTKGLILDACTKKFQCNRKKMKTGESEKRNSIKKWIYFICTKLFLFRIDFSIRCYNGCTTHSHCSGCASRQTLKGRQWSASRCCCCCCWRGLESHSLAPTIRAVVAVD